MPIGTTMAAMIPSLLDELELAPESELFCDTPIELISTLSKLLDAKCDLSAF